ncbi:ABC transporter permease [Nocardioides sp. Soil774]|uniref:ABC transporter permease n=1 Tax=Nocardioides sp. Soil774 TaxID=1736408 RepID=UPI0006F1F023|nr:ABC transporter permease [Nocardioides sp. Soil774]KRE94084.1 ABC transporter permease [Nocardioides sp. Soil774]
MLRLTWRNLLARKVRLLMSALAIVLGIGFLAGVMTFSTGLNATFDNIVNGSTSDAVVRPAGEVQATSAGVGTDQVITPADVDKLSALPEVADAVGSVDGIGSFLLGQDGKLVGGQGAPTLAFNYAPSENMAGDQVLELSAGGWPSEPGEITLDTSSAERGGYEVGDTVTMVVPTAETMRKFTLVGTADFNGGGTAGATLVLLDTAEAQEIFLDGQDAFTSVALTGADGVSQAALAKAADAVVPDGFTAVTGDKVVKETQEQIGQFLDVISIFLTTFAVIAIVVGAFIIFNTFSILVSQRVRESALLRALGASKRQVTRSVLVEAFLMALVGSTLGLLLGLGLSRLLAGLFRSFGLDIAGDVLTLTPFTVVAGYVVGILVTMVAAFVPARRAAKVPPVAAMRDDLVVQEKGMGRRLVLGTIAMVVGVALAAAGLAGAPGTDAIWIGAGAVIWVITTAVLAPVVGKPVLVACRVVFGRLFGTAGRLAGENALRNPRRTGATASALMIGLAVVSAVGVLASSLSATNDAVVDEQFTSDFLVQTPTFQGFPAQFGDRMEKVDGVSLVSRQQGTPVSVEVDGKPDQSFAIGVDQGFFEIYELTMLDGTDTITGHQTLLSESRADDLDAGVGDTVEVEFPGGKKIPLEVQGVFEDTPTTGGMTFPLSVLSDAGLKRSDSTVSIMVADGADRALVKRDLDDVVKDLPILSVQDKQEFKELISGQVNQLLYVIYGLLALAVIIAVIGIVNTLGLSVLERTREIGLLRAVGLSRRRLRTMITLESVAIALLGAVLGMVLGLVIGVVLRESLKDDLTELSLPLTSLLVFLVVAVIFGVLAAIVPAVRASRMKVLDAIATE